MEKKIVKLNYVESDFAGGDVHDTYYEVYEDEDGKRYFFEYVFKRVAVFADDTNTNLIDFTGEYEIGG